MGRLGTFGKSERKISLDLSPKEKFKIGPGSYLAHKPYRAAPSWAPFNSSINDIK